MIGEFVYNLVDLLIRELSVQRAKHERVCRVGLRDMLYVSRLVNSVKIDTVAQQRCERTSQY